MMTEDLMQAAAQPVPPQPKFWTVYAAPKHLDKFVIVAVLSRREDAAAFVAEHERLGTYLAIAPAEPLAMNVVLDLLVDDRLGELAAPIKALATQVTENGDGR